jgi:hypothetical protein
MVMDNRMNVEDKTAPRDIASVQTPVERAYSVQGGSTEDGSERPTITVYFECDSWSNTEFTEALNARMFDEIRRERAKSLQLFAWRVAVEVDGWEIAREISYVHGVWKLDKQARCVWRRLGETAWRTCTCAAKERRKCQCGGRPSRAQIRKATVDPWREFVDDLLEELMQTTMFEWTAQMQAWDLAKIDSASGCKRTYDPAEITEQKHVLDDTAKKLQQRDRGKSRRFAV